MPSRVSEFSMTVDLGNVGKLNSDSPRLTAEFECLETQT